MSNNIIKRTWKQGGLVNIEDLRGMAFQAEEMAHTFLISGVDADGNPIALGGSPAGVLLRPDQTDVALECEVSDGVVTATLPAECYDVPGRIGITIFLSNGAEKVCIYAAIASVSRTSSGTVSPGTTSDVVDLINRINEVVATIPLDYSALSQEVVDLKSALSSVSGNNWFNKDQSYSIVKTNGTTTTGYTINNDGSITCVVNTGNGQVFLKDHVLKLEPDIYNVKCKVTFNASVPNGHREILVRVGTADSAAYVTPKTGYDSSTSMSESDKVGYINYDFTVTSGGNFQFAVMGRYSDVVSSTYPLTIEDLVITQKSAKLEDLFSKSIAFRGTVPNGTNGNDITETGFYIVSNSLTNIPYSSGVLIVYTGNNLGYQTYQLFFAYDGRYPYYRNKKGTSWNDWVQLNADWHKTTTTELNVDNITTSGFYFMTSSNTNKPVNDNGVLLVFNNPDNSSFATYQMFISYTGQNICVRGKYGGAWSNWLGVSQSFGTTNIAWFGDSISALESLPSKTGALISAKTHSFAIPGAPFDTLGTLGTNWKYTYLGFANLMKCLADNDYTDVDTAVAKFIEDNPDWAYSDNMTEFKTLDWSKIDSVVVSYGTNDFNAGVVNLATFKTDIKNAFINLMNEQPHVQIYVFTSPYRVSANTPNSQGLVLTDYVSAIMEVCNELNIPCYDTFHNSGINQYTWETYLVSDQLHLKTAGAKLISQKVAKFLLSN